MQKIAEEFAALIDNTRFDEALPLMAEDCEYHYWEGNYSGRENIVNLYRQNHLFGVKMFDEVIYASEVERIDDMTYNIHFLDKIRVADKRHETRFDNVLRFKDNLIVDIQHNELPGEAQSFRDFYQSAVPAATG